MNEGQLRGALWISDYFPRPHDMTTGTWALESTVALKSAGLPVAVLAPTPWIPKVAAPGTLAQWARVPGEHEIRGIPVFYARCPHYPRGWINNVVYNAVPFLDTALLWPWCRGVVDRLMRRHPFDVVHANFLFPSGYLGMKIKERYGSRLVVHERSVQRMGRALSHKVRRTLYRRILRAADVVLTENESMAAELRRAEPAMADLRVVKQPGTHTELIETFRRGRPAEFAGRRVILSVGALSDRKGHEYLIRAVAELRGEFPDLLCHVIGSGLRRERLSQLVDELGLRGVVELCGKRPHAEVLAAMSWCDVFALPSWGEAGGTVYGEAMQFGTPIVACKREGITDIVEDGVHGMLVEPRDVGSLAAALRKLLADSELRRRIGARGRELALEELSYSRLASFLIGIYGGDARPVPRGGTASNDAWRAGIPPRSA